MILRRGIMHYAPTIKNVFIMNKKIRVLVVEDSAFMRKQLKNILEADGEMEVILARDGEDGVAKAREIRPDVVTMDINLPGMDGISAMQYIVNENICPVVMVSSLTQEGALVTFEAMELGAFDYVPKPGGTVSLNIKSVSDEIVEKVKQAAKSGASNRIRKRMNSVKEFSRQISSNKNFIKRIRDIKSSDRVVKKAVALGISTGGPKTLSEIIPDIPEDLDAALFIVQHMPPNFTKSFATRLNSYAQINIKEVEAGDVINVSHGYLGKGGSHLELRKRPNGEVLIRLTNEIEHFFMSFEEIFAPY